MLSLTYIFDIVRLYIHLVDIFDKELLMKANKILPSINSSPHPRFVEGKAKETLKTLDNMMDCICRKSILTKRTDNDYIIISKRAEDPARLHFDVYNHSGENTDRFIVASNDGDVVYYSNPELQNSNNSDKECPEILKRVGALLEKIGKGLANR